jgi:hypothetical protein
MGSPQQPSRVVTQLVAALRVLAATPKAQREWLAHYLREARARTDSDFWVEELALQFEDAAQALPQFGVLRDEEERALAQLTAQLAKLRNSPGMELFRADALASRSEWAEVRSLAALALGVLDGR